MQRNLSAPTLKILSFGAGAIATYIGGSLALAGNQLVIAARPDDVQELRRRGLRLDLTRDKRRNTEEVNVIEARSFVIVPSLEEALGHGPFDVALFALKSFDTEPALESMQSFAEKLPPLLCLSNGVDNEAMIAGALGSDKVIYGTVTTAISRRGAGDIVLEKFRGTGVAAGHPLSEKLAQVMNAAYLNCRLYADAQSMKWSKMLTNLIANPTSAILDLTAAEIFANPELYKLEIEMLRECLAVMKAKNLLVVDLPGTPVKALALATKLPLWLSKPFLGKAAGSGRGAKMPSFHIDLHNGRGKSEVQYLHGAVLREAQKAHIAAPVNKVLTETLMSLTNGEIPLQEFAHQPQKLLSKLK